MGVEDHFGRVMSPNSDSIVVTVPPRRSQPTLFTTRKQKFTRRTCLHSKSESPAESKQEMESEGEIADPQPPPKRKIRVQPVGDVLQDPKDVYEYEEIAPSRNSPARMRQALEVSIELPQKGDHIVLVDEKDCANFFHMRCRPGADLLATRNLEIDLDATKLDEFAEYRLALALTELHPLQDSTNPHDIQAIRLVMKGNVLFTRYSYHLTSPARSHTVGGSLKKLLTGGFTNEEKTKIPCSINSTEKVLSRALLGIRGVKQVIIEGTGRMEGDFAETIKATLVQPPGTNIIESNNPDLPSSTHQVNGFGKARSKVYGPRALNPYPTRPKTFQSRPSNYETITAQRKRDQSKRWDLKDMVQIMARKQDLEDRGLSKMTPDPDRYYNLCLPLVLTGKGGTVELGWKV